MFSDADKWGSIYANLAICEILNKSLRIRIIQNEASGRGIKSRLPLALICRNANYANSQIWEPGQHSKVPSHEKKEQRKCTELSK